MKTNGTIWAWGFNEYGQLGDGTTDWKSSPVQIGSLTNWSKIVCGYNNRYATKTDGTLWGWGDNYYGQLGEGFDQNITKTSSPIQIGSLTTWINISVGSINIYGTLSGINVPISSGGTGQITQLSALKALMPTYTGPDKMVLTTDGNNAYWALLSTLS
jgi:alpha-tubulin suppressor-like RCC1 family protein